MKFKTIYVVSPANVVTGGPDALHQLVYYLNAEGIRADLAYYTEKAGLKIDIPAPYQGYISDFVTFSQIPDEPDIAVVLPDIYPHLAKKFSKAAVYMWWLGVTNDLMYSAFNKLKFLLKLPVKILINHKNIRSDLRYYVRSFMVMQKYDFRRERLNVQHLCASYHAYDYISARSARPVTRMIEPISKKFLNRREAWDGQSERKDIVLYNPVKCGAFVQSLAKAYPQVTFVPLKGYTQDELIELYQTAKLYIDFGEFHGAERMPKEAVLFGCAVITGRHGASGCYGDVPIPDGYKLDETSVPPDEIIRKIEYCLAHYDEITDDFNVYRETVLQLEASFVEKIREIFM